METIFREWLVSNEWVRKLAHDRDIEELDRSAVLSLVDKIIVHEGCRIEIIFKYEDEYRTACRIVESLPDAEGDGA